MYAVIQTGGKQYKVAKDDTIVVERLKAEPGDMVELGQVLMLGEPGKAPVVGAPRVEAAAVFAEVVEQTRGDKIIVFKKIRRQNHRRKKGHRQDLTVLRILEVSPTGTRPKIEAKKAPAKKPAAGKSEDKKAEKKADEKPAAKKPAAKKPAAKKPTAKKTAAKKTAAKKPAAKKPAAKKKAAKKPAAKKTKE